MIFCDRKKIKVVYTIACIIAFIFMVGYWFYKYEIEDRDIGVVDYTRLEDAEDIKFPAVSLCFEDPFLDKYLRFQNSNVTRQSYLSYLAGNRYDEMYEQIDYSNVTLDLRQYIVKGTVIWQNASYNDVLSESMHHFEVFDGFQYTTFYKCFTIQYTGEEERKVKSTTFVYDKLRLEVDWPSRFRNVFTWTYLKVLLIIHYPGQFYMHQNNENKFFNLYDTDGTRVKIQDIEVLKRRNSRKKKCSKDIDNYDNMLVDKWLSREKCRPPYLKSHKSYPKCNSKKKIKQSKLDLEMQKKMGMSKACQRISRTKIDLNQKQDQFSKYLGEWWFTIQYPEEVRIITQSKEVDIHSLIGNIGGYLGLFLGNKYCDGNRFIK